MQRNKHFIAVPTEKMRHLGAVLAVTNPHHDWRS